MYSLEFGVLSNVIAYLVCISDLYLQTSKPNHLAYGLSPAERERLVEYRRMSSESDSDAHSRRDCKLTARDREIVGHV
jgi:hypothetical protein